MIDKLLTQLLAAGLPVQSGIYDTGESIKCHAQLTTEQQAQFDAIVEAWRANAPAQAMIDEMSALVQAHIDTVARERAYTDGLHCATYANSTIPAWQAEGQAFVAWRDSVWIAAISIMDDCKQGLRDAPTPGELLAELPVMVWPEIED